MAAPTVGRVVHVLVHPDNHGGGSEVAPALVSRVNDDGTVNVRAFPDSDQVLRLQNLAVYDDRDAAEAFLDEHREMLPVSRERDGNGNPVKHPRHEVYRWVTAAYWPPRATEPDAEPVDEPVDDDPADDPADESKSAKKTAPAKKAAARSGSES